MHVKQFIEQQPRVASSDNCHCHWHIHPTYAWIDKKAVLSQGEPRDAAANFDTYRT